MGGISYAAKQVTDAELAFFCLLVSAFAVVLIMVKLFGKKKND